MRRLPLLVLWLTALLASAAEPALVVAPGPAADAWWQRAQWYPRATIVRGVPIKRLHPEWCAAEAFSRETIGEALLAVTPMAGLDFALEGSFDGAGRPQIAFVGAYRRCAGEKGLFVTIVEPAKDRPRMRFLVELPNPGSAFAAVGRDPDGALAVWWCAGCDNGVRIEFNRETRGFFVSGVVARR